MNKLQKWESVEDDFVYFALALNTKIYTAKYTQLNISKSRTYIALLLIAGKIITLCIVEYKCSKLFAYKMSQQTLQQLCKILIMTFVWGWYCRCREEELREYQLGAMHVSLGMSWALKHRSFFVAFQPTVHILRNFTHVHFNIQRNIAELVTAWCW